ncbi:MAG: winged helix-turn-helix transcriptional regulator [Candidatus Pelagibacterales bacterium]
MGNYAGRPELKRDLSPITQQMLIKELRDLEKNKLVLNLF